MRIIFYKDLSNFFFVTIFFSLIIIQQALANESLLTTSNDINDLPMDLIELSSDIFNHSTVHVAASTNFDKEFNL